ncbi:Uncharacterised protein [uncultured archaeon]|nr:Uncharacterised protein [uncultured archaeon]
MDFKLKMLLALFLAITAVSAADPFTNMGYVNTGTMNTTATQVTAGISDPAKFGFMAGCQAESSTYALATDLLRNSFFAVFIVAMGIALLYMAGSFFQLPNVTATAKQELNEMILTAVVAAVFITFLFSSSFSTSLFGFDVFKEATHYSYKMLYKIGSVSAVMISANIVLNSIYTIYIPFGAVRKAMTMQLGPALRPLIDGVSFSLQFLITTYGEWTVFVFMFCFIEKWFLPFFFPLGMLLRAFPHTRGGGNTLIALAVALSTIYPLMFYIDSTIFDKQFQQPMLSVQYFDQAIRAIFAHLSLGGIASLFGALSAFYVSPVMVAGIIMAGYMFWDVAFDVLHLVVMFSILLPILNIFVTISFARELSRALGTEINLGAFAKLI